MNELQDRIDDYATISLTALVFLEALTFLLSIWLLRSVNFWVRKIATIFLIFSLLFLIKFGFITFGFIAMGPNEDYRNWVVFWHDLLKASFQVLLVLVTFIHAKKAHEACGIR
jgi:energy-coupling factor transporter transmembrane protein EcfT